MIYIFSNKASSVLFIPYALKDYGKYLNTVEVPLVKWGKYILKHFYF